ncbi:glycosyltransferase family 2 protein [Candidatus Uhrbacteria bacterium]|nr:glycosyltransferase family 2 protein [Candidatus Uhrbacteria bacterium]
MKVVFPIAGRGSRFQKVAQLRPEFARPKPLIEAAGKPMVAWAIETVRRMVAIKSKDCVFVCLQEHEDQYEISKKLREIVGPGITVYFTPEVTEGAACTALLAKPSINTDEDVLFMDCDHFILCEKFQQARDAAIREGIAGLIPTIESTNPAFSYSQTDEHGNVIRTAEKELISTHASVGIYYFTHGKDFVWAAEQMIKENLRHGPSREFYMCPVYNELIQDGKLVKIVSAEVWLTLGTPDDLDAFVKSEYAVRYR